MKMTRTQVLNQLIKTYDYKYYLEIGLGALDNFKGVKAEYKQGVDPKYFPWFETGGAKIGERFFHGKSDDYFRLVDLFEFTKFDLIFIDGDHSYGVSGRDIFRAFGLLNPNGVIVLHDILPKTPEEALSVKPSPYASWCGEVWRHWVEFRRFKCVQSFCVNADHGVGILKRGTNLFPLEVPGPVTLVDYITCLPASDWKNAITPNDFVYMMERLGSMDVLV